VYTSVKQNNVWLHIFIYLHIFHSLDGGSALHIVHMDYMQYGSATY